MKKNIAKKIFTYTALVACISTTLFSLTACGRVDDPSQTVVDEPFTAPEPTLPEEEQYALQKYDYESLSEVQTTIRADVESVIERNVARTVPEVLSDDYALVYNKEKKTLTPQYGLVADDEFNLYDLTAGNFHISNDKIEATKINFKKYPRVMTIGSEPAWSIGSGIGDNSVAMAEAGLSADQFFTFYRYMLFSQCYNLQQEAATRSNATRDDSTKQEEFKKWLKKHPAADAQYGRVLGDDGQPLNETNNKNAVTKKITIDPLYRSLHATGLYLPAGEAVTIKIEGLKNGETIGLKMGEQDSCAWEAGADTSKLPAGVSIGNTTFLTGNDSNKYFKPGDLVTAHGLVSVGIHNHWSKAYGRLPWVRSMVGYSANGTYAYGSPLGGVIEIDMKNCYSKVTITISGAVETPHYILGSTTPEYFDKYLRQAPGVIAILDVENGQLIGPTMEMGTTSYMRRVKTDEIDKLAMLWHSFLSVNESFTGGKYNRFNKVMFDWLVPAGAAVALGNYSFAQPTGWFDGCMNYRGLLAAGNWGTLHEIGHNHASSYGTFWGFGDGREGEVHNNALTLLSYIMFCDVGTSIRDGKTVEHGEYANPYRTLSETLNHPANAAKLGVEDYGDGKYYHYFQMLGMYSNIMHSFGAEKFYELLYTYKTKSSYVEAVEQPDGTKKTTGNQRSDFMYRCALVYGMNFMDYFNTFYKANITQGMFSAEQWDKIKDLPKYNPVANFYAGGIDGVKTAGDYNVAFGEDITFDFLKTTISTLDTAEGKGFTIVDVGQPEHGKLKEGEDGKWVYEFDKNYTGNLDSFTFDVKMNDGVLHRFTVTLRISYNGSRLTSYNDVQGKDLNAVAEYVSGATADSIASGTNSYIATYKSGAKKDVRILEFYWKAPQTGTITLSSKMDDWGIVYFGESFDSLKPLVTIKAYTNAFSEYPNATFDVEENKFYAVRVFNVNTGGDGSCVPAYKYVGETAYVLFENANVFHPAFPLGKTCETYVYQPNFLVSKKDNISLAVSGTDKSVWSVLKAPENIDGGRFIVQKQIDTEKFLDEEETKPNPNYGKEIPGSEITTDKWGYLVDGQAGTVLLTAWVKNATRDPYPHVFIVDTKKVQNFNYFSVTTRNAANSYITDCELFIAESIDGELNGNWKSLKTATRDDYGANSTTIRMKFPSATGRYFKLVVKNTTAGDDANFSALAELDAGIESQTQRVIPPTSSYFFKTTGWRDTSLNDTEANGYLISESSGERLVIGFKGTSISLYAATGAGFGTADIFVDGEKAGAIDLNSTTDESRKLVFSKNDLSNGEHTVEVVTTSSGKVMLSVVGIPYSAQLINVAHKYTSLDDEKLFVSDEWELVEKDGRNYYVSKKKNSKVVVKFVGDEISLYGATGEGFGTADIFVDGEKAASVDFNSENAEDRKIIFFKSNLENKEHTVEVVTTSKGDVMLTNVGLSQASSLVNASNIYKEQTLTIALLVFLGLFVVTALVLSLLIFVPGFRKFALGNRLIKKYDDNLEDKKSAKRGGSSTQTKSRTNRTKKD